MLSYRTFRNTDPPQIVAIWRSRAGQRGLSQPVSCDLFEQLIFGRLYFDYRGLVIAWQDGEAVGFAHAGFGPREDESAIARDMGVTSVIVVRPGPAEAEIAAELLQRCEQYLADCGAKVLYGGGVRPLNPFYLGLYGGSELPGVLQSDTLSQQVFRAHGYKEIDQTRILRRDLSDFQGPVGRQQLQLRRQMAVQTTIDPPLRTWWEACTIGDFDLTRFELKPRGGGRVLAQALFRNMDGGGAGAFIREAGLIEMDVDPGHQHQGLGTFLLSEVFNTFVRQGIMLVEAQTTAHNAAALHLYEKLGFTQFDQGSVFRKE